jgi:hypothetical protein
MRINFILLISILSVSIFAKVPTIGEKEFIKTLNQVRQSFKVKDMSFHISKLESLVKSEQIDIADYGLGKGVFKYWLQETTKISKNQRANNCKNQKTNFPLESILKGHLKSDKYLRYTSNIKKNLSVLSEQDAQEVFNILKGYDNDLVYSEYGIGCESRAYAMNLIMDEMCINSAKAFVESEKIQLEGHSWSWYYHVAPIVLVRSGDTTIPFIMDPAIFDSAVPLTTWIEKLREQHYYNEYAITLTSKYVLLPSGKNLELSDYRAIDIDEVNERLLLRSLLRIVRPFMKPLKN